MNREKLDLWYDLYSISKDRTILITRLINVLAPKDAKKIHRMIETFYEHIARKDIEGAKAVKYDIESIYNGYSGSGNVSTIVGLNSFMARLEILKEH